MKPQGELPGMSALRITPESGRTEPRLWVRRLVVWSEPGVVLRDIPLRPGFNIVWSPDPGDSSDKGGIPGALGHGSGKTLFCRLLRYFLGEDRFAPDNQRDAIAFALPDGMAGAEIIIDGVAWSVLRPVGKGRSHWAIPDGDLDLLAKNPGKPTGMEPFLKAVEEGLLSTEVAGLMPGSRPLRAWPITLAWLSRDQECRFDHPLDWRSPESDSGSPARSLSKESGLDAVRALIGAIVPEELQIRNKIASMLSDQQNAAQLSGHRDWETEQLLVRLAGELGLQTESLSHGRFGVEQLRQAAKGALAKVASVDSSTDVADLDGLRAAYEDAQSLVTLLKEQAAGAKARIPELKQHLKFIESELGTNSFKLDDAQNPICPVCEVPVDRALAEGCKLSHKLPDLEALRTRRDSLQEQHAREKRRLAEAVEEEQRIGQEMGPAADEVKRAVERLRAVEKAQNGRSDAWFNARRLLADADRLDAMHIESERFQAERVRKEVEIAEGREREKAFRDRHGEQFNRLSEKFDAIIREIVGQDAKGRVTFDGNGLKLSVELGGDRSTAAIDSLKVIAFDLAAMCLSIEGRTRMPAFLLHDSPREADLGISVYHRLFRLACDLERVGEQPLFQYILTTTTRPPEDMQTEPWLREILSGSPAEARLLKTNL